VRAFHNVCRHRAGPLVEDGDGHCAGALVCRYHGWKYALDGRLASARDFGVAEGFDPREYALFPIVCETWRGFVFVNLDADAAPLMEAIAPLERRMQHVAAERFRNPRASSHEMRCNWKTYVENYLEGYHIPVLHPSLNATMAADYGTELEPPTIFYRATPKNDAPIAGLWAWAWPCLGVNVYADGILMERMWPVAKDRTRLDYLFLFSEDADEADIERQIHQSIVTTQEDIDICEAVQRNLEAGVYQTGRLSPKHEQGVAWFQKQVLRAIG
jgi:choline monooxygenase